MKKFLSLVLALVMAMSLVTISAGATDDKGFTDASDIEYKEAVDVMSGIGIISGYRDGSFRADGALTRGAAAKIIAYLNLGQKTADVLSCSTAPYKDVNPSDTFAPYIAYVKNAGIVDGYSDGTFRAGAPLTGFAFSKMLLTSLGYDSKVEGFTGANWSVAVAKLAVRIGLTDGNDDFTGLDTCTREEACLYALNVLQATEVEYDNKGTTIDINGATIVTGSSQAEEVTTSKTNYETPAADGEDDTLQFCEDHYPELKLTNTTDDSGAPANKWVNKGKTIGTYAQVADFTFTTTADGDTNSDKIKDTGLDNYQVAGDSVTAQVNGANGAEIACTGELGDNNTARDAFLGLLGKGRKVEVYTDNQTITDIVVTDTYLAEIDSISSASETVTLKTKDASEKTVKVRDDDDYYAQLSDMDEGDFVLVSIVDGDVASVAIPETVTSTISRIAQSNGNVDGLTMDGTSYKLSATSNGFSGLGSSSIGADSDSVLYVDSYGFAIWIDDVDTSSDYIAVMDSYKSLDDGKLVTFVQGVDADGNELSLNIGTETATAGVYKYTSDDANDGDYVLTTDAAHVKNPKTATSVSANAVKLLLSDDNTYYFASDIKTVYVDAMDDVDDVTVEDGAQKITVSDSDDIWAILDDGKIVSLIAKCESDDATGDDVAYVEEITGAAKVGDKNANVYTLYIDGDKVEDVVSKDTSITAGSFVTFNKNSDDTYKLKAYTTTSGDVTSVATGKAVASVIEANKDLFTIADVFSGNELNADDAVIVDLTDEKDIGSMNDLFDVMAGADGDMSEADDNKTVTVSIVYNGKTTDDDAGDVAYIFVTNVEAKN